jgi:hypothetical protein
MAKKRRLVEKEEEEYEFVPPEFDEKEFILKDLYGTKILIVVSILAIVIGILCACLQRAWAWYGGLALLVLTACVLKQLLKSLKFDVDLIEQKSMIGNYVLFLLLGLGVWVLFINPPFM